MEDLIKGELDWHNKVNENFHEVDSQMAENMTYSENSNKLYSTKNKLQLKQVVKGVAFGDSLTYSQDGNTGNQASSTYPQILQAKLGKIYGYSDISIINAGTQGQTSIFALANVDSQVIVQDPDFCIMMWGTNDCNQNIDLNTFKDNLRQVIKKLIKANIEVILLAPPPTFHTENDRVHRQQLYSKTVIELAQEMDIYYIDMFNEISNIILQGIETPISLMPDSTHFAGNKYFYLADIIIFRTLLVNKILEINTEIKIPIWHSPYAITDITTAAEWISPNSKYKNQIELKKDGSSGSYLRFIFFNKNNSLDLILVGNRDPRGGILKILDNGVEIKNLDFYSNIDAIVDVPSTVIKNLDYGIHIIEFLISNLEQGKATDVAGVYFSGFEFKNESKYTIKDIGNYNANIIKYEQLIESSLELNDVDNTKECNVLCDRKFTELQTDKLLIIKCRGRFYNGFGFSWFVNPAYVGGSQLNYTGYIINIIDNIVILSIGNGSNYTSIGTSSKISIDYSIENEYKITHDKNANIKIYINNSLVLEYTDINTSSGYCGLYSTIVGTGTALIKSFEFAYS